MSAGRRARPLSATGSTSAGFHRGARRLARPATIQTRLASFGSHQRSAGPPPLTSPEALATWLSDRGLVPAGAASDQDDLRHAIALRAALRGIIGANSGAAVYPVDVATLNEAASASKLRARFGSDGAARLEPEVSGVTGALGRIVAAAFAGMADEDWSRLKLCGSQTCRWGFFYPARDHSRRWGAVAACG